MTPLAPHISAFLQDYLAIQRGASPHTCDTYAYGSSEGELRITTDGGTNTIDLDQAGGVPDRYVTDLAFDPTDGTLYGGNAGSDEDPNLFTMNKMTGGGSIVGQVAAPPHDFAGFTFESDGQLYGLDRSSCALWAIDKSNPGGPGTAQVGAGLGAGAGAGPGAGAGAGAFSPQPPKIRPTAIKITIEIMPIFFNIFTAPFLVRIYLLTLFGATTESVATRICYS